MMIIVSLEAVIVILIPIMVSTEVEVLKIIEIVMIELIKRLTGRVIVMFTIIKYALAGYGGYMLYQEYIAKSITVKRNN